MRELSMRDMEIVSGAVGPVGAAIGAASAAAGYIGYATARGEGNLSDFLGTTAMGALGGFVAGPAGATAMQNGALAIIGTQSAFYAGMAGGFTANALDAAGTDYNNAAGTNYN
ncbi:hypothetical protein [Pseudomonas lopnurensis]|uniref:hypothetical protein n=1 Tax=Pseudomonas lopnurensis TaxID=1477517 RepID=UPI0028A73AF8|nr:hypothetical protein [Pseudomonas lopnurensis]